MPEINGYEMPATLRERAALLCTALEILFDDFDSSPELDADAKAAYRTAIDTVSAVAAKLELRGARSERALRIERPQRSVRAKLGRGA